MAVATSDRPYSGGAPKPAGPLHTLLANRGLRVAATSIAVGIVICIIWELLSGRVIDELWISKPSQIWASLVDLFASGQFAQQAPVTAYEAIVGFILGAVPGGIVGLLLGRMPFVAAVARPYIVGAYAAPRLALAPLFIIWFGIGPEMKIWFTASVVFFPVFINAFTGSSDVSQELLNAVRLMNAKRFFVYRKVILPSTLIWIFAGLKQAIPLAVTAAVVGELLASNSGLGFLLVQAAGQFQTSMVFAILLVLAVFALIMYELLEFAERRLFRWKTTTAGGFGIR